MKSKIEIIEIINSENVFEVHDNENITYFIFLRSGENKIKVKIGENAKVNILGVIIGGKDQTIKLYTDQEHVKKGGVSDLLVKSVLFDQAKFSYEGFIKIQKGAGGSDAYQKNQNLLLSKDAQAISKPTLEILADDVRCTHGVTVGQLDKEQLYYLMTRGLDVMSAKKMLALGFLNDVLLRIPDIAVVEKYQKKILNEVEKYL